MTNFFVDKYDITKKIVALISPDYTAKDLQHAKKLWWNNIRRTGGLGLTPRGKEAFDLAGIEYWDIHVKIAEIIKSSTKLKLDQYFPSPYYIFLEKITPKSTPIIRVYDGRVAALIALHGGLIQYLASLHTRRTEMYSDKKQI